MSTKMQKEIAKLLTKQLSKQNDKTCQTNDKNIDKTKMSKQNDKNMTNENDNHKWQNDDKNKKTKSIDKTMTTKMTNEMQKKHGQQTRQKIRTNDDKNNGNANW